MTHSHLLSIMPVQVVFQIHAYFFCCKLSVVDSSATSVAHIREGGRQTEMDRYLRLHGLQFSQVMFCFQDAGDDCQNHSLTSSILPPLQLICHADDPITAPASSIDNVTTNSASPQGRLRHINDGANAP